MFAWLTSLPWVYLRFHYQQVYAAIKTTIKTIHLFPFNKRRQLVFKWFIGTPLLPESSFKTLFKPNFALRTIHVGVSPNEENTASPRPSAG